MGSRWRTRGQFSWFLRTDAETVIQSLVELATMVSMAAPAVEKDKEAPEGVSDIAASAPRRRDFE